MASGGDPQASDISLHVQFMVACENISLDMTQNLSLLGIFDGITAPVFPTVTPSFHLVFGLQNVLPGVYATRVSIEHTDGTVALDQQMNDTIVANQQRNARVIVKLMQFVWQKSGIYLVKLWVGGELVGAFSLTLLELSGPGLSISLGQPPSAS
jgi:hypothetical protein